MSIGARANFFTPSYDAFGYTDYNKDLGRCLDSTGLMIVPDMGPDAQAKGVENCSGSGPSASLFSPQLVATFHLDVF